MRFYLPHYLWLLALLPVFALAVFVADRARRARSRRIGRSETVVRLFGNVDFGKANIAMVVFLAGIAFIIAAMARPQYPGGVEKIEARGGKIVVALDLSLSMLAQDFQPNRLEKARREIIDLVEKLKAQTVGLVVFAGEAFVQCPPTIDYSAFRMFLDVATVGMISDTGTNLADAIDVSAKLLDDGSPTDKAIIVLTDGESFEGDPEKAASESMGKGIRVYTIGVGSSNGRPIPESDNGGSGLKKNTDGEIIISRLDSDMLAKIADKGNGKFFRATPGESELDDLYSHIKGLKGEEKEKKFRTIYNEKYRWLLVPGLILLGAAAYIPTRKKDDDAI
jgi:Ca-activated chloride channel family protein